MGVERDGGHIGCGKQSLAWKEQQSGNQPCLLMFVKPLWAGDLPFKTINVSVFGSHVPPSPQLSICRVRDQNAVQTGSSITGFIHLGLITQTPLWPGQGGQGERSVGMLGPGPLHHCMASIQLIMPRDSDGPCDWFSSQGQLSKPPGNRCAKPAPGPHPHGGAPPPPELQMFCLQKRLQGGFSSPEGSAWRLPALGSRLREKSLASRHTEA